MPSPSSLPGAIVIPVEILEDSIPWLPMDNNARPGVNIVGFNHLGPPFNNAPARRALAYAINREELAEMAERYRLNDPKPATNLTPPQTIGRDLYNEVGARFDPFRANELLATAGYADPSAFPEVTFLVNASGDTAPGARFNMANAMADMWQTNLGIVVEVEAVGSWEAYTERLRSNPPDLFWLGWAADYNDPDNFLRELFHSDSEFNLGHFSSTEFDRLVEEAASEPDPGRRQELYIRAEQLLTETEAALIPIFHSTYSIP
jgi:ABC-type oligopeptide transport system substrate-binding subunit